MPNPDLLAQIVRFVVVGGTVTLVFMALNRWFGARLGKNGAFLAAYPPAVVLHFCLNKWWTFADGTQASVAQTSHYLLLTAAAFVVQWGVFQLLTRFTGLRPWLASGVATVAQMAIAFVVMRAWVFAKGVSG